jgi:polyisoprenoid-binding protein YceI
MSRTGRIVLAIVILGVIGAAAVAVYVYSSGGSGQASRPIDAPTLVSNNPTEPATQEAQEGGSTETPDAGATSEAASGNAILFNIVPEESEVRFEIDEDLRGARNTVIGRTDQVAGQIEVDFDNPPASQVGTIRINVRTLVTDDEFRNRAIRGQIMLSARDEYEFGEFAPTSITGLPDEVTMGEPISFQVTGDLTLRGSSNPVTFDVTVTPVSETRLEGTASAVVDRTLYGMEIPSVPGVANVEEEVELYIDFVATA